MSDLLWLRKDGRLTSGTGGLQLIVTPTDGGEYRFQLLCDAAPGTKACMGSGQCSELGDAIDAAERAARRFKPQADVAGRR